MATRIFGVEFWITELYNGREAAQFKETKDVVAKNALDAINKVRDKEIKPYSYKDDETGKMVKVTRKEFEPMNIILRAQADN